MPLPTPAPPAYSPEDDCAICNECLHIPPRENETSARQVMFIRYSESFEIEPLPSYTIDDVELKCRHHFHWGWSVSNALLLSDTRQHVPLYSQLRKLRLRSSHEP